jgi:spore coat polysaccharide biosynthesis predicted glycosyltransferase SpsG
MVFKGSIIINNQEKSNILFITKCGSEKFLGFGHIYRCINIAKFYSKKFNIYFIVSNKETRKILKKYDFIKFHKKKTYYKFIFCDLPNSNKINFLDYKYNKLIIIDEFNNFTGVIKAKIFKSVKIRKFLFLKFSNILNKIKIKKNKKKIDFLISFGGSDYYNLSPKIFNILKKNNYCSFLFVKKLINKNIIPKKYLVQNYYDFLKHYKINAYIGSGGNTMFEMLEKKIPCLIIPTNKMEKNYVTILKKKFNVDFLKINNNFYDQVKNLKRKKKLKLKRKNIIKNYNLLFS